MTYKITIYFVLFCASFGFAQNTDVAKLNTIINWLESHVNIPEDSTQIGVNAHKAIELSKKTNNQNILARSYRYLSLYHREYSKLDSALFYIEKVKDLYTSQKNDVALANTFLDLKTIYALKTEYGIATEKTYKALELFEKTNNQKGIAQCYSHIGDLLYYENRYAKGVESCEKAIIMQKQTRKK